MTDETEIAHLPIGVQERCDLLIELERRDTSVRSTVNRAYTAARVTAERVLTSRHRELKAILRYYSLKPFARVDGRYVEQR